ncbi:CPBP family intramembrane glutamic endopeptidase [Streptomyces sp. NPDC059092]|uniref:CPBP family intramembrane glutamic endopeptidase n=1 Tax=Streptomyces sp. NPDC059092 TaxID=3346725 RepID=UPI0036CA342A
MTLHERPSLTVHPTATPDTGIRGAVRRRPMLWFFAGAMLLSWVAWTPYILSETGLGVLDIRFPALLGTSQLLGVLPGAYLGPITAALLVTAATGGRAGLRAWVARLTKWRVSWRWYAGILLGVPAALVLATLPLSGGDIRFPSATVLVAYLPVLVLQIVTTGLAEEPGWRDFALPRLQDRYGPLVGTLILGPLWGVWHLPLFFSEWGGYPEISWLMMAEFVAGATTISLVMTWVFNRTGESLPMALLLHVGINTFASVAGADMFPTVDFQHEAHRIPLIASGVAAVIILIATRGRLGHHRPAAPPATTPTLDPAVDPAVDPGQPLPKIPA